MTGTRYRKIPTQLKRLAEKRARVDGEVQLYRSSVAHMDVEVKQLSAALFKAQTILVKTSTRLEKLKSELVKIDQEIVESYPAVRPDAIEPILATKGRYGKKMSLKGFLLNALKDAYPEPRQTNELAELAESTLGLTFIDDLHRARWVENSVRAALKHMQSKRLVDRGPVSRDGSPVISGLWRWWVEENPTLATL